MRTVGQKRGHSAGIRLGQTAGIFESAVVDSKIKVRQTHKAFS